MDQNDWERLGQHVVNRRVELGMRTRQALADSADLSARLLADIEKGRRTSYSSSSLAQIEQALRWTSGSVQRVLSGGQPALLPDLEDTSRPSEAPFTMADPPPVKDPGSRGHRVVLNGREINDANALFRELLRGTGSAQLSARELQELADAEWVRERMEYFPADVRQQVKDYIDEIGRSRHPDWDQLFDDNDDQAVGDNDTGLNMPKQGSQPDYELARRTGETEDEIRERLGIPYD